MKWIAVLLLGAMPIPVAFYSGQYDDYCVGAEFCQEFDKSGIEPTANWPVFGVATPTVSWYGDDPTGANAGTGTESTTHAFTASGDPTASLDTPFCYDEDNTWASKTNCMQGVRFDGDDYYQSDSNGIADCASGDCTFCAVGRVTTTVAASDYIATNRDISEAEQGVVIYLNSNADFLVYAENNAAGTGLAQFDKYDTGSLGDGWFISCGVHDYDGNLTPYVNGDDDSTDGSPGGTIDSSASPLTIAAYEDGTLGLNGDLVAVWFWDSVLSGASIENLYEHFAGLVENSGHEPAFANTGPTCAWVGGEIECYSDSFPVLGAAMPPGATGAASPATGGWSIESWTNSAVYSLDLSTGWTETGSCVACSQSLTPFADSRATCKITDNAAGWEYIDQKIAHGLSNGDKVQVCIYARDDDGAQTLDIGIDEVDGVCSGGVQSYPFAAASLTTSWTQYAWTHTIVDDTCTNIDLLVVPHDIGDGAAGTGHGYYVAQVFLDRDTCPPVYIETGASAVAAGDSDIDYAPTDILSSGSLVSGTEFTFDYTSSEADIGGTQILWQLEDTATATDKYYVSIGSDEKLNVVGESAEDGSATTLYVSTGAITWTEGTTQSFVITVIPTGTTTVTIDGSSEAGTTDSMTAGPDSLDKLYIGGNNGAAQVNGWLGRFKVDAP